MSDDDLIDRIIQAQCDARGGFADADVSDEKIASATLGAIRAHLLSDEAVERATSRWWAEGEGSWDELSKTIQQALCKSMREAIQAALGDKP